MKNLFFGGEEVVVCTPELFFAVFLPVLSLFGHCYATAFLHRNRGPLVLGIREESSIFKVTTECHDLNKRAVQYFTPSQTYCTLLLLFTVVCICTPELAWHSVSFLQ